MKKILCGILVMAMLLSTVTAFASREKPTYMYEASYLPGETVHIVTAEDCIATKGASIGSDGVQISTGGSATWGFYLPYGARTITINYSGSGKITMSTKNNKYNPIELEGGTKLERKVHLGNNLGYDKNPQYRDWGGYGVIQEYVERRGEVEFTIEAEESVKIHELRFEKEKTMGPNSAVTNIPIFSDDPDIQRYGTELMSVTLMHDNAPVIIVNGGRRYIDNNNPATKPYFIDGAMYLPINTLAKALGYYHEVIPEKNYALLRSDTHEIVKLGDRVTITRGQANPVATTEKIFVEHNGDIWCPVKYLAELAGETVGYRDGVTIIDNKYTVADIIEEDAFFEYATAEFKEFTEGEVIEKGKTYYVAQNAVANDKNSGSSMSPFKTLKKAASVARAGDTVIVREGIYREVLAPQNDGTANAPVTFKAAEGEKVVISAADSLGRPALFDEEKNIYIFGMDTDLGIGRNQVYINGELQTEARHPNANATNVHKEGISNAWSLRGDVYKKSGDQDALKVGGSEWEKVATAQQKAEGKAASYDTIHGHYDCVDYDTVVSDFLFDQEEEDYWKGGMYVGIFSNGYAMNMGLIESSSKGKIIIDEDRRQQRWWWNNWAFSLTNGKETNNQWNWGMVVGHKNAMDLPGEWVKPSDEDRLYMILPEGTDPQTVNVEAKARQLVVDLTNRKFVNVIGFETIGGSANLDGSEMCMLNGMDMKYITHYTISADARGGYLDFPYDHSKPGAPQRGEMGLYYGGRDNIFVNSKIDHSAAAALYVTGLYSYIENNIINDVGYMGAYVSGILIITIPWTTVGTPRGGHAVYNNTVYNAGRGCISFDKNEDEFDRAYRQSDAPFIAVDVAYNDFHDGCLVTQDAGTIYSNGTNGGFDKQFSTVRNNYFYSTKKNPFMNHYEALVYWDGNAHGYDTFDNLIFVTGDLGPRNSIIQNYTGNEAYDKMWNNQFLAAINVDESLSVADALDYEYFSEERPFYAGSIQERKTPYTKNYDRFASENYVLENRAIDAEASEGVTIDTSDGYARFTGDGQWLHFKDVDFGNGSNEMIINYTHNANWSFDEVDVIVGDSIETGKKYDITISQSDAPSYDQVTTHRFLIDSFTGKNDVWLKVEKYYSVRIGGISVMQRTRTDKTEEFSHLQYLALYTDRISGAGAQPDFYLSANDMVTENPYVFGVKSTWTGNTVRYAKQTIEEDSEYFVLCAGSRDQYLGQLTRVYLCEPTEKFVKPTGEPVAEIRTINQSFNDLTPLKTKLLKEVKAGTYDIYLEFVYEGKSKTSNMTYFGFIKEGADSSKFSEEARYQGGRFVKELSIQDIDEPFEFQRYERMGQVRKLIFANAGTRAGYNNVNILGTCDKVTINYFTPDEEHGNQPITVRVVNDKGEQIAKGGIVTEPSPDGSFKDGVTQLDNPVGKGTYTVYLDFGGEKSSDKVCQIGWFRFERQ